ncbi:transposase family protein [Salinifilum aidingensis]
MLSYPSGMSVSSRALNMLAEALRQERRARRTRWRRLDAGQQALLVLAYLRKGDTYADLAIGFDIGVTTAFRYIREALGVLSVRARSLDEAITLAARKTFVALDGTLLRIDRVGMATARDRPYYSGKHTRHGVNVQVIADPAGRLIWASPALPGARHDMGAARDHGLIDALDTAGIRVVADSAYRGADFELPQRRRPRDNSDDRPHLSTNQKAVNVAHARLRGPGERANAQLTSWKILRRIRGCPHHATLLVNAVQTLIHAS